MASVSLGNAFQVKYESSIDPLSHSSVEIATNHVKPSENQGNIKSLFQKIAKNMCHFKQL